MGNAIEHFNINDFSNIIKEYDLDKRLDTYNMFEELHYTVTHAGHAYEFTDGAVCDWLNTWDVYTREELSEDDLNDCEGGFHTDKGVYYIPTSDTSTLIFEPRIVEEVC